ncbi:MAG: class I SAM-dependent methyltransferase [Paracoccus sp. (in: a-proteobacteria)]|uniref:class I SAM-dependent methyltransferase n=1 Tax=Paracoccus sp. TaxID=267 RepID=UPI0026E0814B|nr:class I SAM-dependent methyltransferase [Paracoccus sp. (in: a-proteobacteria)]MDO5622232.1 class I SAM-dependent methyltransferase [Paracoccus sp. (in: a-proteobacteria)]
MSLSYPPHFHPEQSPLWMGAVSEALGRVAPAARRYCEIGCGSGFGATLLAAANPDMQVVGIDLDAGHIAAAQDRAAKAGLSNVRFYHADIADFSVDESFDYITCHGVLSWVAPATRTAIADFIARHLAPGGLAAVQYMSAPGGAAFAAFHALFRSLAHRPDPVAEGLAALVAMRDAGAGFFQMHPHAGATLDSLLQAPKGYVAHEYLSADFAALPCNQVFDLFRTMGVHWIGSATPVENIDAASLPGACAHIIAQAPDPAREVLKDIARNQALRYDLFSHPAQPLGDHAHLDVLRQQEWALLPGVPTCLPQHFALNSRIGPVAADPRLFSPMLSALAQGPRCFAWLERLPPFSGRPGLLNQVLQMAMWARMVHPAVTVRDASAAARLNRLLLTANHCDVPALAAPGFGSGLALDPATLAALLAGGSDPPLRAVLCLETPV